MRISKIMQDKKHTYNNRGLVLLLALSVMAIIMAVAATMVMRAIESNKINQRNKYSTLAYYEAEAGLSYAYAEEARNNFSWYTHEDKNTPVVSTRAVTKGSTTVSFYCPVAANAPSSSIDPTTGCYTVAGRNFKIKTFPEQKDGIYTGVTVLLSQATVNGITRTLEFRVGKTKIYQFFFFYPTDKGFSGGIYDARNYGGIHVNGDILLYDNTTFAFLSGLTCSSQLPNKGYIRCPLNANYTDLGGGFNYWAYTDTQTHFYRPTITLKTGNINSPGIKYIYPYLDDNQYSGAAWLFQKYSGTSTTPAHTLIDNENLKSQAKYELPEAGNWSGDTNYNLLTKEKNVTVAGAGSACTGCMDSGSELAIFQNLIKYSGTTTEQWNSFWDQWKTNHQNDYQPYHSGGMEISGNDWERRYFIAANHWNMGTYSGLNKEWWQDLEYGNDRTSIDYKVAAAMDDPTSGLATSKYFLNTQLQGPAWEQWLAANDLNTQADNKTFIQDRSQGAAYLDPGVILSTVPGQNAVKNKALQEGIYIGMVPNETYQEAYDAWYQQYQVIYDIFYKCYLSCSQNGDCVNNCVSTFSLAYSQLGPLPAQYTLQNPIPECTTFTQFYNVANTADGWGGYYYNQDHNGGHYFSISDRPSCVLKIDVAALKTRIESDKANNGPLKNFNGVVYADLANVPSSVWPNGSDGDKRADGIMLVNGYRLPDGGLSLGTPNNVFVKGDYNLDPDGVPEKNRVADDAAVTGRYNGLEWQPAEIITQRYVYTLSNNFPEPRYLPMYNDYSSQYINPSTYHFDYNSGLEGLVNDPSYPTNSWAPNASAPAGSRLYNWFTYYKGQTGNPVAVPNSQWNAAWINQNWPSGAEYWLDTNGDGKTDTYYSANQLISDAQSQIQNAYTNTFNYTAVHGNDGSLNSNSPSMINTVSAKHVYNMAIISPYDTSPQVLEKWANDSARVINGAFIQLPPPDTGILGVPGSTPYVRASIPANSSTYNYETRFGKNSNPNDIPRSGLTFGADSSWREIPNANF